MYSNNRDARTNRRNIVEFGYISMPSDVDRTQYIETCLREENVAISTLYGEFILRAKIDKSVLQKIEFPTAWNKVGSFVLIITEPIHNEAVVVAVLNRGDDSQCLSEHSFDISKRTDNASVSIVGEAVSGNLFVKVKSLSSGGSIFIDVENANEDATIDINVSGTVNLQTSGKINIQSSSDIQVDSDSTIILGKENLESATLGDTLKQKLDDLLTAIQKMVLTTPSGPTTSPPVNWATDFQPIKDSLDDILSKLNKVE